MVGRLFARAGIVGNRTYKTYIYRIQTGSVGRALPRVSIHGKPQDSKGRGRHLHGVPAEGMGRATEPPQGGPAVPRGGRGRGPAPPQPHGLGPGTVGGRVNRGRGPV